MFLYRTIELPAIGEFTNASRGSVEFAIIGFEARFVFRNIIKVYCMSGVPVLKLTILPFHFYFIFHTCICIVRGWLCMVATCGRGFTIKVSCRIPHLYGYTYLHAGADYLEVKERHMPHLFFGGRKNRGKKEIKEKDWTEASKNVFENCVLNFLHLTNRATSALSLKVITLCRENSVFALLKRCYVLK